MECYSITPEQVNLKEWEQSGEGWNAITYFHKTDGSLLLKLNSEDITFEDTANEFKFTKAVYGLGVKCPEAYKLVTDGKRFGYITERIAGKKSFARILSERPELLEPLAKDMAEAARELHSMPCDTDHFKSIPEHLRKEVSSCAWIKKDMKALLNSYADSMRPVTTCLHGDMHPGNYLRAEKGDFWIDLGRFGFGDPDMDYANQYMLANLTPESTLKWILHIDRKTYSRFVELFGEYYYGKDFHTTGTQERLRRAVCLILGHTMARTKAGSRIYGHYVRGHEKVTLALLKIVDIFIKKKEE